MIMDTEKIRKVWNEAFKHLTNDVSDALTLEEICCMFFELGWNAALERNSTIHWQTGEPKEEGTYLTTRETSRGHIYTCENFWYKGRWYAQACDNSTTIAWCKLSDIKQCNNEI